MKLIPQTKEILLTSICFIINLLRPLFRIFLVGLKYILNILHYYCKILMLRFRSIQVCYLFTGAQIDAVLFDESIQIVFFGSMVKTSVVVIPQVAYLLTSIIEEFGFFFLGSIVIISLLISC